jgi:hypothetical protein
MPIRKAISDGDTGTCIGNGGVWKQEGDKFRVLHIDTNDRFLLTEESIEMIEREYEARGVNLRPLNR